ncbi:Ig-like domain-containing protein [Xanthomonas sp. WHRI 1810A]|uniref:Ig-like domain-containing protein n=1 Tax=Xanthomonas sp. WHRI 1810A TaxID=3161565 RepID=UPI0032E8C124
MDNIVVANKTTSEITTNAWGDVQLSQTSVVQMPVPPSEVAAVSRNGQNLTVTLKSGERVTVNNFFNADPNGVNSDMVFQNQDGTLWQARYSTEAFNGFTFEEISSLDSLLATTGVVGSATPEWAFAGLGLLGAGGAAAASGAGGGGGGGGGGGAAADVSAPTAPSDITLSADGLTVRGIGEPGATINVRDVRGNVLGSAVVPADGNFTVPLNAPQLSGESLIVDQTDASGNVSASTPIATPDSTAPVGPANLTVTADGRTLTGTGEAGATITVRAANGTVLGSVVVAADGTFTVPLGTPQVTGAPLTVDQTDAAGNVSASTAVATPDSTAPGAPGALLFNADGSLLTGTAEPGATVQLRAADGTLLGSAVAAADGTFSLTISPAQDNGQTLVVSAIDAAGNTSATSSLTAPDITPPAPLDATPPAAPTNVVISGDGSRISGRGEVGATVTILDAAGLVVATASVDADGTFNVPLIPAQTNGQALTVNLTDAAGNVSGNVAIGAPDLSQPAPPANLIVAPDGLTMTGTGRAGFRIFVRSLSGRVVGVSRVAADGTFVVALAPGQVDGERLEVTAVDASGNSSASMMVTAPDTTLPPPVTDLVVSPDGGTLAGKGEAGDTVTVRDVNGALIATGTVAVNGTFIITLVPAVAQGVVLGVTQADAAGNVSPGADVTVPDGTGPVAPVNPVLSADGTVVTGSGRPGDTIEVRDANGNVLGSAVVGLDGTYSVPLSSPQLDGQVLDVVAVAPNGVESVPTSLATPDLTAPDQPTDLAVNPNGQLVTGRGEPGATVTVRDANGNVLATALVGTTGAFAVPLPTAQVDGQALQVTLTDAAGNSSTPLPVSAPDLDGPLLPGNIAVAVDGSVLTGNGESGSTVTVTTSTGVVLGTAVVGADGVFSVALNSAQNNGQTLLVSAIDADGNASAQVPFITPDTQVPVAVTDLTFDATGDVLSGTGEPGATVTVRDASGTVIGSVVVDPDGTFSVALSTTQDNAQLLQVVQADARGNLSTAVNTTAPDLTDPAALTNVAISANGTSVTGNGEIGATVTVLDSQGNAIGSAVVGANARFEITLTPAQNNGQTLSISQADAALNATPAVPLLAPDILPPGTPTSVVSVDGVTVTGIGEEGATVTVRDANGTQLGSALAGPGGVFSITLVPGQSDGERLNVSQADGAGNQSVVVGFNAIDTTPPAAPGALAITTNGALLTGTGEPGSTVTVLGAGSLQVGTAVVGSDGTFTVPLTPPQLTGQQLSVTLTDASSNPSGAATILSPDFTAPGAPTGLDINAAGTLLSGNAENNTTVTVIDANGVVLGTAPVINGAFTFVLSAPLLNGELLSLVVTDAQGNASQPLTYAVPDTTAPADVANLVVSPDGLTLSGTGEAGTTVTITRVDGVVLGRGPIDANGVFVVTLSPAAVTADILTVIATDGAGLASNPIDIVGPDGTGLPAPTALALTPDGFTLTGTSVIGATITVLGTGNVALGTAIVGSDGTFSVLLQSPQLNAQILHVTASNATGTSVAATFTAGDSTAPDAPTNLLISSDGSALSGRGEVGATVTVRNADGTLLGVAVVDGAGVFSVPLVPAQLNAQALTVAQTDRGLNLSQPATVVAPDLVSPAAPTGLSINTIGTVVSGQGEAGATVTVRDATGTVLATGVVDQSGNFQVTLPIAQLTGATDRRGASGATGGRGQQPVAPGQSGDA